MQEATCAIEAAVKDLSTDIKSCDNDCSCSSHRDSGCVSMPICYLVKEQAKSFVAIQELQRRMGQMETVQDDVIEAIVEFRNFLSESVNYSIGNTVFSNNSLNNTTKGSIVNLSKLGPPLELLEDNVLSPLKSTIQEIQPSSSKAQEFVDFINECETKRAGAPEHGQKISTACASKFTKDYEAMTSSSAPSQKHFELVKSKDSALESDKQDSGLDSDCREHHDIQPSYNRNVPSITNSNIAADELWQMLDEIDQRSSVLQHLVTRNDESNLPTPKDVISNLDNPATCDFKPVTYESNCQDRQLKLSTIAEISGATEEHTAPTTLEQNKSSLFETRALGGRSSRKNIDNVMVSSILKETNIVDLQRQALIYLVDNAVLNMKLQETEQLLSSKLSEKEKVENVLREEARLLMMENRELRICLDESRMETSSMQSRLAMLERVLQSVTSENQELNWQLGESFNLPYQPRRGSTFRLENPSQSTRRYSFPSQSSNRNEFDVNGVRPKAGSINGSFLEATFDVPNEQAQARSSGSGFRYRQGPMHSSTPMFQKSRAQNPALNPSPIPCDISPANFQSVKKRFETTYTSESGSATASNSRRCLDKTYDCDVPGPSNKVGDLSGIVQSEEDSKFPFNTIIEKLKSNSEYRLSKRGSASDVHEAGAANFQAKSPVDKSKVVPSSEQRNGSQARENPTKTSHGNSAEVSNRKTRNNIQQRIQNVLDGIVAESEEAS